MKTIAVHSIKGGVGKTTTAVNLAAEAARSGARVLVWDLDPQGAATYVLRAKPTIKGGVERLVEGKDGLAPHVRGSDVPGVDVVPADAHLKYLDVAIHTRRTGTKDLRPLLRSISGHYDVTIIDCVAGTGVGLDATLRSCDVVLVPVVPTTLSVRTLEAQRAGLAQFDPSPQVLAFVSMIDRRRAAHRRIADALTAEAWVLRTRIPSASVVERLAEVRGPLRDHAPRSTIVGAYEELWQEIATHLW